MNPSRRRFLQQVSRATAAGAAGSILMPKYLRSETPEEAIYRSGLPFTSEEQMKEIAGWALDAAKSAGASFVDVRVSFGRSLYLGAYGGKTGGPGMSSTASVGIRAVTDGVWGFAGEATLKKDAIVELAQLAVARARAARPLKAKDFEYVPAPPVPNGRWESPYEVDPFTIRYAEHEAYLLDAAEDVAKVKGVSTNGFISYGKGETVFASSEGSLIFQRVYETGLGGSASTRSKRDAERYVGAGTDIPSGQYGYELVTKSNLKAEWHKAIDEAFRLAQIPFKSVEVGRYPMVMGRAAMANFVVSTIAAAVMLNRARGDLANGAGTSYAAPPADILGKLKVASPLLTLTCDRYRPRADATIGWDADGVKPDEFTIVNNGIIVDYITTRDTAGTIADWYQQQGKPLRSHGCSMGGGMGQPYLGLPNLTIKPGRGSASDEDLYKDMKKGYYAPSGSAGGDQQLINNAGYFGNVFEVANGKITHFATDFATQFNTVPFWAKLDALGGPESAGLIQMGGNGVFSVPGRIKEVNVINTGKEQ